MNYLDVPEYGKQNRDSGKERLYYQTRPLSALSDLDALVAKKKEEMYNANDRTYDKGEYVYDPATGKYTFVPRASAAAVGLPASPNYILPSGRGGDGYNEGSRGSSFDKALQDQEDAEPGDRYAPVPNNNPGGVNTNKNFVNSILSNPLVGRVVNFFGSKQNPNMVTVEDRTGVPVSDASENAQPGDRYASGNLNGTPNPGSFDLSAPTNTVNVNDAAANAAADSARAYAAAVAEGMRSDSRSNADGNNSVGGGPGPGDGARDAGGEGGFGDGGGRFAAAGGLMEARYASGGLGSLGDYSDGGQLLRGPGDGVSDSIPASIANKRPARLADGEFVVPSRIVSELGNGSTEAGARKLYAMLDRIQAGRKKSIGKGKVAVNSKAQKQLPA